MAGANTRRFLLVSGGAGLLLRLALAPLFDGYRYDMALMRSWALSLLDHPLANFYRDAESPDHLPGDMPLLWLIGHIGRLLGPDDLGGNLFLILTKSVPAIADLVIAVSIYAIVARVGDSSSARRGMLFFLFNPASLMLTAVWGQWDAVSMAMVMVALLLVLTPGQRWIWAVPLLAWAVMIKPPLALTVPFLLAIPVHRAHAERDRWSAAARSLVAPGILSAVAALATLTALGLPFRVGLPGVPTRWSLVERVEYAVNRWPNTTMGAANIWALPFGSMEWRNDLAATWLGVTANRWGMLLIGLALCAILFTMVRHRFRFADGSLMMWGPLASQFALFLLPTRVHEW
jgi:dolichyl-phosphate-mannose-protein mannosyltransferase